jgi:hypothetical protein
MSIICSFHQLQRLRAAEELRAQEAVAQEAERQRLRALQQRAVEEAEEQRRAAEEAEDERLLNIHVPGPPGNRRNRPGEDDRGNGVPSVERSVRQRTEPCPGQRMRGEGGVGADGGAGGGGPSGVMGARRDLAGGGGGLPTAAQGAGGGGGGAGGSGIRAGVDNAPEDSDDDLEVTAG